MNRLRIAPQAVARSLLDNYGKQKPLSKEEAERIQLALENSGVDEATTRLTAGFAKLLLAQLV